MLKAVRIIVLALAACCLGQPAFAQTAAPASDPDRLAAARELMDVTGVSRQMEGMVDAMSEGFKKGMKTDTSDAGRKMAEEFEGSMRKFLGYKEDMLRDFAALYAENFTVEELKQAAEFYRTGAGAKYIQFMPVLMQKGAQIGLKYSERMMSEMSKAAPPPEAKDPDHK